MPYSKKAKYRHHRQRSPKMFIKSTFETVPLSHTEYSGRKLKKPGAKAIVGVLKPQYRTSVKRGGKPRKWRIQSILVPKKK